MTEPLRYRFYVDIIDKRGDLVVTDEFAETAAQARDQAARRLSGHERIDSVAPKWDAVLYPDGQIVSRKLHEEAERDKAAALALSDRVSALLRGLDGRRLPDAAE